jgi:hypothetical protein
MPFGLFPARVVPWGLCAILAVLMCRQGERSSTLANGEGGRAKIEGEHHLKGRAEVDKEFEKPEMVDFLKTYAPIRYKFVTRESAYHHEVLKRILVAHAEQIIQLKVEGGALYETKLREMRLEDQIFGDCIQLKRGAGNKAQLESDLKSHVAELFDQGVHERTIRIEIVKKKLDEQEKSLKADVANKEQLVTLRFDQVKREGVEGMRLGIKSTGQKSIPDSSTVPSVGENEGSAK